MQYRIPCPAPTGTTSADNLDPVKFDQTYGQMRSLRFKAQSICVAVLCGWMTAGLASARDTYFAVDAAALVASFDGSQSVTEPADNDRWYQLVARPRVQVPSLAEAYLEVPDQTSNNLTGYRIIGRRPAGQAIDGTFYLILPSVSDKSKSVLAKIPFTVPARGATRATRKDFLAAKGEHFVNLWSEDYAGAAMFRSLATESLAAVGRKAVSRGPNWPTRAVRGPDETMQLMSGGRAISENLQLDRQLDVPKSGIRSQRSLTGVKGISVPAINWKDLLSNDPTELDPLARLVPEEQYAVFMQSFDSLATLIRQGGELGRPVAQMLEPQSRVTDVLGFYQGQLGLSLNQLSEQVGRAIVDECVLTGSDPYFRTGTDIALLLQTSQPDILRQAMQAQVQLSSAKFAGAKIETVTVGEVSVWHASTPDRSLCSYVADVDNVVVVSNSITQLGGILETVAGKRTSMHSLDEYKFFRQRYPRSIVDETTLVVITDAAIRRWCGPAWRIGASRRTRARGTIAEITMRHADQLIAESIDGTLKMASPAGMPDAGKMMVANRGAWSARYGSLDFQTPIVELGITTATEEEIKLYEAWRVRYERLWRRNFDPIAVSIKIQNQRVDVDLSVLPLVLNSQYQQMQRLAGNASLVAHSAGGRFGDQHPSMIASYSFAVDANTGLLALASGFLNRGSGINLFTWIDGGVQIYVDDDPKWRKNLPQESAWNRDVVDWLKNPPIGIFVPSNDNLRMTGCVVALRGALQQFAPNMVEWKQHQYRGIAYNLGTIVENNALGNRDDMPQIGYVTTSKGITLSPNDALLRRTIDRHLDNQNAADKNGGVNHDETGESSDETSVAKLDDEEFRVQMEGEISGSGIELIAWANSRTQIRRQSKLAWSNVPALNYLRHRYPDRDPAQVYARLFGEQIVGPADGDYVWNPDHETYESSNYGSVMQPKDGPVVVLPIGPGDRIRTQISFQDNGLRAKLSLEKANSAGTQK